MNKLINILSIAAITGGFYIGADQSNPFAIVPAMMMISIGLFAITALWADQKERR